MELCPDKYDGPVYSTSQEREHIPVSAKIHEITK